MGEASGSAALNVLGPLVVIPSDGIPVQPGSRRQRRTLSVLAVAAVADRVVSIDELLGAVYGDDAPANVRRALFTEIWRCRQLLGSPDAILGESDGYLLNGNLVDLDALRFIDQVHRGSTALVAGEAVEAVENYAAATQLWRGSPIPDWQDHPEGLAFAARLTELRLGGAEGYAEALAAAGDHRAAIAKLSEITREDPVREHAWALLVESLIAVGDHRRARGAFDTVRRALSEFGVEPGAELTAVKALLEQPLENYRTTEPSTVLELAAAIGSTFDKRLLLAASIEAPTPMTAAEVIKGLDAAVSDGIIRPVTTSPHEFAFVGESARDDIYQHVTTSRRALAHTAIYRALRASALASKPESSVLAHHAFGGWPYCPTADVVAALTLAGDEASRGLAFEDAQRYYRQSLDAMAMDPGYADPADVSRLLQASGQAAVAAADLEGARRTYESLAEHGWRHGDVEAALRGAVGVMQTYASERVDSQALDEVAVALEALLAEGSALAGRQDLVAEALAVCATYRPQQARALLARVVTLDPACEVPVLQRVWEQESVEGMLDIQGRLDDLGVEGPAIGLRRWVAEITAGRRALDDAPRDWSLDDGSEAERWESHLWQSTVAIATGNFARADRPLVAAAGVALRAPSPLERASREASIRGQRVWLAYLRNDLATLAELILTNPPQWSVRRPIQRVLTAFSAPLLLPAQEAWDLVDEIVDEVEDGLLPGRHQMAPIIALSSGCISTGHERGMRLCHELLQRRPGFHGIFYFVQYWGCVEYHVARLAAALGDYDQSIDLFTQSLTTYRWTHARCFEAWTLRAMATVYYFRDHAGDRDLAAELADEAHRLAAELGMGDLAHAPWPPREVLDAGRPIKPAGAA